MMALFYPAHSLRFSNRNANRKEKDKRRHPALLLTYGNWASGWCFLRGETGDTSGILSSAQARKHKLSSFLDTCPRLISTFTHQSQLNATLTLSRSPRGLVAPVSGKLGVRGGTMLCSDRWPKSSTHTDNSESFLK